eukprot:CAMPEP_0204226966 /NCGR_PEP_ID=MMETSP0361-20130328/85339_1 /ASSEMBLY_ACC=CAM_ASM_000343 /TAXON_ID=268821 /ORGANISM="Scrippsiella Hangoei, Strain SHTV-5" /LENGTH=51 /DNA_ID=CAMNT_0051194181 /DNA_START=37 /DNA_END=189 /DNA_ORIENTATION=-
MTFAVGAAGMLPPRAQRAGIPDGAMQGGCGMSRGGSADRPTDRGCIRRKRP